MQLIASQLRSPYQRRHLLFTLEWDAISLRVVVCARILHPNRSSQRSSCTLPRTTNDSCSSPDLHEPPIRQSRTQPQKNFPRKRPLIRSLDRIIAAFCHLPWLSGALGRVSSTHKLSQVRTGSLVVTSVSVQVAWARVHRHLFNNLPPPAPTAVVTGS